MAFRVYDDRVDYYEFDNEGRCLYLYSQYNEHFEELDVLGLG